MLKKSGFGSEVDSIQISRSNYPTDRSSQDYKRKIEKTSIGTNSHRKTEGAVQIENNLMKTSKQRKSDSILLKYGIELTRKQKRTSSTFKSYLTKNNPESEYYCETSEQIRSFRSRESESESGLECNGMSGERGDETYMREVERNFLRDSVNLRVGSGNFKRGSGSRSEKKFSKRVLERGLREEIEQERTYSSRRSDEMRSSAKRKVSRMRNRLSRIKGREGLENRLFGRWVEIEDV